MATVNISKTSAVIFITVGTQQPKSYFGNLGSYEVWDNLLGVRVLIQTDEYNVALTDLLINGVSQPNLTTVRVLLNAIFGT